MSLVNTLMSGSGVVPTYEGFLSMDELYTGRVCDNYLESYVIDELNEAAVDELVANQEACLVADVIGEVNVIKEGANPQILMEGIFESIKNTIKKFFEKIADFFKNLFTSSKKKAEDRKRSEEAAQFRREIDELKEKAKLGSLTVENNEIEIYEYAENAFVVYKDTLDSIVAVYGDALDAYNKILVDISSDIKLHNTTNGKDHNYKWTDHNTSALKGANDLANKSKMGIYGYNDTNDDVKAARKTWEDEDSLKTRHDKGYDKKTADDKERYDLHVKELKDKYDKAKNPLINGNRLTNDEAKMSIPEYLKYLMRGKHTEKTIMTVSDAFGMFGSAIAVNLPTAHKIAGGDELNLDKALLEQLFNGDFVDFCIGGNNNKIYKESIATAVTNVKAANIAKQKMEKMIKECEKNIKSDGDHYDEITKALSTISNYVRTHTTDITAMARVSVTMYDEMSAAGRMLSRKIMAQSKSEHSDKYNAQQEKNRSAWEKDREAKLMRESYGLFEQAYSTGLI